MENAGLKLRKIGMDEIERVRELFLRVFTAEPWNDDWSDTKQLTLYLRDLAGQGNSLCFGLFDGEELAGASLGHVKHWFTGTEYCIEEFFIRTDRQGQGLGTFFLAEIEKEMRAMGLRHIFLQTEKSAPAYGFYLKNGFHDLEEHRSLVRRV